ncbi:nucleotidyl transferase AbiEii/AbiGii toxin family protein [Variovorax sp. LT1P1]|uniref:nucleotidyl transferase AbiEii/AbiGii toxin family protein n=1 Tax=Variovorax sp. LT1P1 TaxID=3443730 RepID=UPI003F48BFFD
MFEREHHRRIAKVLAAFDAKVLEDAQCFFGGGTAIALSLGEYRRSDDIDMLCSSQDGYRTIRNLVNSDLGPLLKTPQKHMREVRADRYGIRTVLEVDGEPVKFEIVNEGRIVVTGAMHSEFGVPTLSRVDMYAEKLLANADRARDKSVSSRDIIDLAMMIDGWGPIPPAAWQKAVAPYGASVEKAFRVATEMVTDQAYLASCLKTMQMDAALAPRILAALGPPPEPGLMRTMRGAPSDSSPSLIARKRP